MMDYTWIWRIKVKLGKQKSLRCISEKQRRLFCVY